ncbi:MAG: hypothetical protein V3U65_07890 [Granulosicoccaceae bacterium]
MMDTATAEFVYRLPGNTHSVRPGAHRSNSHGAGMNFVSHAKLIDQPDPRRLDLRASINNIQKDWLVRVNKQRAAITVSALVDVSQSMRFGAQQNKLQVAAEFLEALGFSAGGLGDSVSLVPFDSMKRDDLTMPARFGRGTGQTMAEMVLSSDPTTSASASTGALSHCIESIAGKSALSFIVSDFHWPLEQLDRILEPLAGSLIVPLVIWDRTEITPPDSKRLLSVRQMGSKHSRHLWLTPTVRQQWEANVEKRQQAIADVFATRDVKPFWITDGFDPESLSRYFMETRV